MKANPNIDWETVNDLLTKAGGDWARFTNIAWEWSKNGKINNLATFRAVMDQVPTYKGSEPGGGSK